MFRSKTQWHCGTCSQCIDRRIAILSAGLQEHDPDHDYAIDVFTGSRKDGYERNMAIGYVRHAFEMYQHGERGLATLFHLELARAVRHMPNRREAAGRLVQMHMKHAAAVNDVLLDQLGKYGEQVLHGKLDPSSMLALVVGQQHLQTTWRQYASSVTELLTRGLPLACKSEQPKNELRLQELCDGILQAHESQLVREYPFMRWAFTRTKPDWSAEHLLLWIELKYVRTSKDLYVISEAIAADITKYSDSKRHVLFVIYDPNRHIAPTEEAKWTEPLNHHKDMIMSFVR